MCEYTGGSTQHRRVVRRIAADGKRNDCWIARHGVAARVERTNLDVPVRRIQEHTPVPTVERRVDRFRFRAEECCAGHRCRPIDATKIHAAPLRDDRPDKVDEVSAVRQERGPAVCIFALSGVEQGHRLGDSALGRNS